MRLVSLVVIIVMVATTATATPKDVDISKKQLELGVWLLKRGSARDSNVTISPYSVHSALMLLRLGARGDTAAQFDTKLLPGSLTPELQTVYQSMNSAITNSSDTVTSVVANSLWLRTGYEYGARYRADSERVFAAEPRHVDYQEPEKARAEINEWVSTKTKSLIPHLLPQGAVTTATTCTLVNALYFKSAWVEAFKKELTKDEGFWLGPTKEIHVPMMHRSDSMGYFEDSRWVGVHLPYKAYDYTFVVIVPKRRLSVGEIAQQLSPSSLSRVMQEQKFTRVNLSMPKFKVRQSQELLKPLEGYGLTRLAAGDYTDISPNGIGSVGAVVHESVVSVDEGGTEAAAATAVVLARGAFIRDQDPPKDVRVDRPFAFALMHRPTQAPLFLGIVGDPR